MEKEKMISILESLLFANGDPLKISKLQKIMQLETEDVDELLKSLSEKYSSVSSGLAVARRGDEVQMVTDPDNKAYVDQLVKSELQESLSQAALEVVSIIAYRGPVTRFDIESVRGVNCSYTLRNLLMRGLIEREGNPQDSRGYVYKISFDFLKKMGVDSVTKLPDYEKLSKDERIKND